MDISNNNYSKFMMEGIEEKSSWGYGFRRLNVKAATEDKMMCPYTFTGFGYKEQDGRLYLGLRMNVDQVSPAKFTEWDGNNNVMEKFAILMRDLLEDFINKRKNLTV